MVRWICSGVCVLLVLGGAWVHGMATHRWAAPAEADGRMETVHGYSVRLADYIGTAIPSELPVRERSQVTCKQYLSPTNLPPVAVSITSGPAGAVSTHTPDVCYPGSGYKTVRGPRAETITLPDGTTASYFVSDFEKRTQSSYERQRVRWAWSTGSGWLAPTQPRLAFVLERDLYKLYVVTAHSQPLGEKADADSPAIAEFVQATLLQYSGLLKK